jgi:hypothetical protein
MSSIKKDEATLDLLTLAENKVPFALGGYDL